MTTANHITASCTIGHNKVFKNGKLVFEDQGLDAPSFLIAGYKEQEGKYPKYYKMDNLSKLGFLASEYLLGGVNLQEKYSPEQIGLVLTAANSSLDTDEKYYATVKEMASPALFVYTLPNIVAGEICIRNKFKGENTVFLFPEPDAEWLESYVSLLLHTGVLSACLCGWVDYFHDAYRAHLLLVEKGDGEIQFKKENILKIYQQYNG